MKMKLPFIIASLALSFTVVGCGNNNIPEIIIPTSSLMSIAVTKNPNKTTYLINEEFDSTGLEVTATYRDKTTAVVTEYTLSGFNSETAGVKTITVSYKRKTTSFTVNVVEASVNPTGITLSPTSLTLYPNQGKALTVIFAPSNANSNLGLTWSSNSSVITVDDGMVFASASATTSDTAIITATSTYDSSITASVNVTIEEEPGIADYTLLFYVCGSNLESNASGRYATKDIKEILQVRNQQPDSVNIVVETGGASSWGMSNVSANELGRFIIDKTCSATQMKKVGSATKASMGKASTLQDFLTWGFTNYPAQKYGLFMWNHGGAMDGCCYDELFDDDQLFNDEVYEAVTNARSACGMTEKLEFIAYDACLMAVQDIAEYNSLNFNYMVSSQESEWAGGYDYDNFLPTLYADPANVSTVTLLKKVADTFMDEQEGDGNQDQTQSVFDLTKMADYKDAWEDMVDELKKVVNSSSTWNKMANAINKAMKYGYDEEASEYNDGYSFDVFDVKGALTQLKSTYSSNSALVAKFDKILEEFAKVVVYSRCGTQMTGSNGMCLFCPISGYNQYKSMSSQGVTYAPQYSEARTHFSKWRNLCQTYGSWWE